MADIRPTPEQRPIAGGLARLIESADKFARKPFGYENPPAAMVSDFLSIPPLYRTLENYAYGSPLASGTSSVSRYLPKLTADTKGAIEGAINVSPVAGPVIRGTRMATTALGKAGERLAERTVPSIMQRGSVGADLLSTLALGTTSNVIKPEGGNWIKGAAQKYVEPIRARVHDPSGTADPAMRLQSLYEKYGEHGAEEVLASGMYPLIQEKAALNRFVDKKLTRYIQNEMGTPSDSLRIQADAWADTQQKLLADKQKQIDKVRADIEKARRERNVNPEVLTRSQARLRELQKEQDLINNRKGIHSVPQSSPVLAAEARRIAGVPEENMGVAPTARRWENATDKAIRQSSYQDKIPLVENSISAQLSTKSPEEYAAVMRQLERESLERLGGQYAVDNPEALAYGMNAGVPARDLGFDHMMDELQNSLLNEALPEYLRLTPKTLDKMSVAQAAEHVDKINAWRASQKAEVDKARAANAATVVHKEYPEQGLKWVELKVPEMLEDFKVPEQYEIRKPTPSSETFAIWDKKKQEYIDSGLGSEEAARRQLHKTLNQEALQDALKYEGEILQHCVGGYCPDVVEGRSRIFSLRDADGRPHATIEVQPADDYDLQKAINWKTYLELQEKDPDAAVKYAAEIRESLPSKIKQIKGAQNRKPEAEFIPYIQDFVKSDDYWGSVGDLGHTDLIDLQRDPVLLDHYLRGIFPNSLGSDRRELLEAAIDANPDTPRFMTLEQLRDLLKPAQPTNMNRDGNVDGYAEGGKKKPSPFDQLEPTFGQRMGAAAADKLTEAGLWLYDKLADRDKLSSAHKIYLDTFVHDKRDPITAADFNPQDLVELQNLIQQKEKLTGGKGRGYIQYQDYKTLPGGDQRRGVPANLTGGVLPPRLSLGKSLGQFNYERDPKTGQFRIIDEYDFNPQTITVGGEKVEVPLEFYGDYVEDAGFSPYALARLYGGRKMPPGKGRKVELSVPGKAEGGGVYSPRPGLVFVGQEHGASADVPQEIRDLANQVGAFYEGSGGDKLPDIRYRGSWDDAASRSVKGYPPEYLYTIFTNTDVNRQKDALVGDGTIFNNLLKNQQQVGYFKDRRFNRKDLSNFLQSMGPEFLRDSQNPATESNVEDFLRRGEQLMWESGDTPARQLADKANESRQRWLLNQPKGVFFMGSDHLQKLKELHGANKKAPVKKAEGGLVDYDPDEIAQLAQSVVEGLAPYGVRHSGEGVKGKGYFGPMVGRDSVVTEMSAEDESGEYPLVVPTLTAEELDSLIAGEPISEEIYSKARSWADTRRARGQSPFADPTELRMPRPGYAAGGIAMQVGGLAGGISSAMKLIKKLASGVKKAEKDGDIEEALNQREQLNEAIKFAVNSPEMPRAKPLTKAEIDAYAERMAPQIAGELTRGVGPKTMAGKSQKQFKREQTLPVDRKVLPGAVDPSAPLPYMTLEDQKGSVLLGLPGDPTLARVSLSGIDDVPFAQAVTQHGGPRYGDDEKLWASNLSAATNLLNAADRASKQYGNAPVIASYMKMPTGFGFAQHYLETLLQYQRPDLLNKAAREALEKDIKEGFVKDGKRIAFPNFPGFDDLGAVAQAAESDSNLRKHIAAKLGTSDKYGLRPAADVQFAVSHPELTNLETGASGFTLGEIHAKPLALSSHPTYEWDILGKVLGQMRYSTPYDLLYRDQLDLIRRNPKSPEFNTLKGLGARQKIDEQLVNEVNEYQERLRQLIGKYEGGIYDAEDSVGMQVGGGVSSLIKMMKRLSSEGNKAEKATDLTELVAKLPKASPEVEARVQAQIAAREKARREMYDVPQVDKTKGKAAIAEMKRTLMSPEERAAHEAQLREQGLQSFLEPSAIKERLYHGTKATEGGKGDEAIRRFKLSKEGSLGSGLYLAPSPNKANRYADPYSFGSSEIDQAGNVLPVFAQIRNPLIIEGTGDPMIEALIKLGVDEDKAARMVERAYEEKGYIGKQVQSRAQAAGYDGIMQYRDGELSEVVSYNPSGVKSAIGNRGTYDITDPDITKRRGGVIKKAKGGVVDYDPAEIDTLVSQLKEEFHG